MNPVITRSNRVVRPRVYFMDQFDLYYPEAAVTVVAASSHSRAPAALPARRRIAHRRRRANPVASVSRSGRRLQRGPNRPVLVNKAPVVLAAPPLVVAAPPLVVAVAAPVFVAPAPVVAAPAAAAAAAFLQPFEPIPAELLDTSIWDSSPNLEDGIFRFPPRLAPVVVAAAAADGDDVRDPAVEICFSFDTTGSMSVYVNEVKQTVEKVVRQLLGDLPDIRISIIAHGDFCDYRTFVLKRLDLSSDVAAISDFIMGVEGTFGGDREECYELVLREAQSLAWSPTSAKALVMIGDSSPHKPTEYLKLDWEAETEKLRAMGVRIYGVRCGGSKDAFYEEVANRTGGSTLEIANFQEITELIMGLCYLESAERVGRERRMREVAAARGGDAMQVDGQDGEANNAENDPAGDLMAVERIVEIPQVEANAGADEEEDGEGASMVLTEGDAMTIHFAIHSGQSEVEVGGKSYEISLGKAGCRLVRVGGQTFVEQNKDKRGSKYAQLAIEGRKITWIIRKGKWGLIMGERQTEVNEKTALAESGVGN